MGSINAVSPLLDMSTTTPSIPEAKPFFTGTTFLPNLWVIIFSCKTSPCSSRNFSTTCFILHSIDLDSLNNLFNSGVASSFISPSSSIHPIISFFKSKSGRRATFKNGKTFFFFRYSSNSSVYSKSLAIFSRWAGSSTSLVKKSGIQSSPLKRGIFSTTESTSFNLSNSSFTSLISLMGLSSRQPLLPASESENFATSSKRKSNSSVSFNLFILLLQGLSVYSPEEGTGKF